MSGETNNSPSGFFITTGCQAHNLPAALQLHRPVRGQLLFACHGPFTAAGLSDAALSLKPVISNFSAKFQYDIFAVFVELYQNIERHGLYAGNGRAGAPHGSAVLYGYPYNCPVFQLPGFPTARIPTA